MSGITGPRDADFDAGHAGKPLHPALRRICRHAQIGHSRRDGFEPRFERPRQAQERNVELIGRRFAAVAEHGYADKTFAQQRRQLLLHAQRHMPGARRQQRDVARELQRIAQALLGLHIDVLAGEVLALPRREWKSRPFVLGRAQAPLVFVPAFAEIAAHQQQQAESGMRIGVMRCERDGAAHCRCAVVETPAVMQRRAEIGPCIRKVGSQFDGATVGIDGVIEPSQSVQRIAEIAVRFGKSRLGRDSLAVRAGGFAKLPHLVERDTEIAPCFGVVRPKLNCAAGGGDRVLRPSGEAVHLAEIAVIERDARVGSDGALHEIDGVRQLAFLMRNDPKEIQCRCTIGSNAQDFAAQRLGGRQSARLHMLLGPGERVVEAQRHRLGAV